jgi:CCR4-NOT transcription complex subunit 9
MSSAGASGMPSNQNPAAAAAAAAAAASSNALQVQKLYQLALDLASADKREAALLELSKKREAFPDLAPILWHSVGTIAALLQEIIFIYPLLQNPTALTPAASNRCCNALALLQCVASHPETRSLFLNGVFVSCY